MLLSVLADAGADISRIEEIERACFRDPWTRTDLEGVVKFSCYQSFLAEEGGQVCGYCCLSGVFDEAEVLNIACGHLEGTSLPVGGDNTHCVLSAHRGLPHARLFTDLDKMEIGDTFQLTVLDRTVTYQVDQIKVVRPDEIDDVQIVEGVDLC